MNPKTILWWVLRILLGAAIIFFSIPKLTGDQQALQTFSALPGAPLLRYLTGILELVGGILLLVPRTALYGAAMVAFTMLGAIASHLFVLGTGGPFPFAIAFLLIAGAIIWLTRNRASDLLLKA
jgi:putative oxidoreductase